LTKTGNFSNGRNTYVEANSCAVCGESYLMNKHSPTNFCSKSCCLSVIKRGKRLSDLHKASLSAGQLKRFGDKKNHPRWKGGVHSDNLPLYVTYANRLKGVDYVSKFVNGNGVVLMEVRCAYCGKHFVPSKTSVVNRMTCLNQKPDDRTFGEGRFYCSVGCRKACPIFNMRKFPKGFKKATSREVQPELRQLVLKRDNYICQKCGKTITELHCHHIEGIKQNPIESADIDNCVTLCKKCHKEVHNQEGCKYHELWCKEE
jgi:hypothetical protein